MLTWIKIAVRNLLKNRRRSLFTLLAIAFGFAAVNVFGGFTEYIFQSLEDSSIYAQGNGHLTVFKKGFLTYGKLDPLKFLLNRDEIEKIKDICKTESEILLATPQLHITGLISNGQASTIFLGVGRIPSDLYSIQKRATGMIGRLKFYDGTSLQDDIHYGVSISVGLAKKLKLEHGSDAIAMSPTVEGQINALDMKIFNTFYSALEELDDKLIQVPLEFAQSLYDTSSADRITILLNSNNHTNNIKRMLETKSDENNLDIEIITWQELSPFYTKVKNMFDVIFVFIFIIVLVIVVMSIINTIGMSIMERTREIGTLRALGLKRRGVIKLFTIESTMLGVIGSFLGMLLTLLSWIFVKLFEPTWIPPNIPRRVPLEVFLVPRYMLMSFAFLLVLSVVSAMLPTRKAASRGIVDALGHV
jgi:putative ABC transport system permease protein